MHILFYIRKDYMKNLAGDSIQLLKTKEYLEALGVAISISHNQHENLEKYDLIHLFNTIKVKDTYSFFLNAQRYKKKICLSPIYWNYFKYIPKGGFTSIELIYWREGDKKRKDIFHNVDIILPSSEIEMKEIEHNFKPQTPYKVIPNGVDVEFLRYSENHAAISKIKDYVLCVGRVCRHKNQLSLAKVTKELNLPLVLVGPLNDKTYFKLCMEANPKIIYIPMVDHLNLSSIYKGAKVHALVSWYEIPGLVNLEAAIAGCNLVTTQEGTAKEYFENYANYVNPYHLEGIFHSIKTAHNKEKSSDLSNYVKENYLWERVAKKLLEVYEELLK